ncbi:hypothetical protein EGP98_00880 [bacterium]|nr:hypothetical protein [bacterium]
MIDIYQELVYIIDNSIIKKEIKECLDDIYKDDELVNKIKRYHETYDEVLRKEIYSNNKYIKYKTLENRLNLLILSCNKYLGEIKDENN